jgi:hypothetical protein
MKPCTGTKVRAVYTQSDKSDMGGNRGETKKLIVNPIILCRMGGRGGFQNSIYWIKLAFVLNYHAVGRLSGQALLF